MSWWIRKLTAVGVFSSAAVVAGAAKLYLDNKTSSCLIKIPFVTNDKPTDYSPWLAKHVLSTTDAKDKNFVFSPLSIHVVLSMVTAGSIGQTRSQLLAHLKSNSVQELNSLSSKVATLMSSFTDGGPRLLSVNGVWVDQTLTFKPAFKDIIDNCYKATSNRVDFLNKANEVREEVNEWAKTKTNGLIKDLLPPGSVDSCTRLILANALYFKGTWANEFKKSLTKDADFFLSNGTSVRAPFMRSSGMGQQFVGAFDGFKVLRLPYKQGDNDCKQLSMYMYLPDAKDGLPSLIEKFGSVSGFIEKHVPDEAVRVGEIRVPKFKINSSFEPKKVLKGQGLVLSFFPFIGGLTEMVENGENLVISEIYHKACIEVDEQGTEAAAATAAVISEVCAIREKAVDFVADHPFLFVVREDVSGGVLFVGQVVNPSQA